MWSVQSWCGHLDCGHVLSAFSETVVENMARLMEILVFGTALTNACVWTR